MKVLRHPFFGATEKLHHGVVSDVAWWLLSVVLRTVPVPSNHKSIHGWQIFDYLVHHVPFGGVIMRIRVASNGSRARLIRSLWGIWRGLIVSGLEVLSALRCYRRTVARDYLVLPVIAEYRNRMTCGGQYLERA